MTEIFRFFLNNSIAAGWLIIVVILLRLIFKNVPRKFHCALWILVGIRIICPFFVESPISLVPSGQTIPDNFVNMNNYEIESGFEAFDHWVNPVINQFVDSPKEMVTSNETTMLEIMDGLTLLWMIGVVILLFNMLGSYIGIHKKVRASLKQSDKVYICDQIRSPFVFGILKGNIYIPSSMNQENVSYILAHEQEHLRRRDHLWKLIGYILVILCWFHPLVWVSYWLLCRDMELACDENVISRMEKEEVANYAQVLLTCEKSGFSVSSCPVAFGECSVKERIKAIVSGKKVGKWVLGIAAVAMVIVAVCFLTNPKTINRSSNDPYEKADTPYQWTNNIQVEDLNVSLFDVSLLKDRETGEYVGEFLFMNSDEKATYLKELVEILNGVPKEKVTHLNGGWDSGTSVVLFRKGESENDFGEMIVLKYDGEKVWFLFETTNDRYLQYENENWCIESEELNAYIDRMEQMIWEQLNK